MCNADGTFARTQCHFDFKMVRCWEVDKYGKRTGKNKEPYIFQSTRHSTEQQTRRIRTIQPMTNDASTAMFRYLRRTTENEIVETNPETTEPRQPISKVLLKQLVVVCGTVFSICAVNLHDQSFIPSHSCV